MLTTVVSKTIQTIASSTGVGVISTAPAAVFVASTGSFSTASGATQLSGGPRRIAIYSTNALNGSYTITGTREGGLPLIETVAAASAAAGNIAYSTQDFLTISSIVASCTPLEAIAKFGTSSLAGTPWQPIDVSRNPISLGFLLTLSTSLASMTNQLEYTVGTVMFGQRNDPLAIGSTRADFPWPFISTAITTATAYSTIGFPITGWRLTLVSTSTVGIGGIAAVQAGMP